MQAADHSPLIRQVVDVSLELRVREYRAEVLVDSRGNRHVADFPPHIKKAIQYGPSVKSLAVYLSQYQLLPYGRVREAFRDQFGLEISEGSLCNFNGEAYDMLSDFEKKIGNSLGKAKVFHVDETGIKVDGGLEWLHVVGNDRMTLYFPRGKRGKDAMEEMGVIPDYGGVLCHDHWKPYMGYECRHALCNAHHLRELEWVVEFKGHKWAGAMKRFLKKLNKRVDENGGSLCGEEQKKKRRRYREIIRGGKGECPIYVAPKGRGKRGRVKQTKERNLLDRLMNHEDETLLFMTDKKVPFTNNQAERDIRMVKVQQKISGQFKTMKGARHFCRIRSYLMTTKKRGNAAFDCLQALFAPEYAE